MSKKLVLILFVSMVYLTSTAQSVTIKGYLKDSTTLAALPKGKIINATQKTKAVTDSTGFFTLMVNANDFIFASSPFHQYKSVNYSMLFRDTVTIYLASEGNVLPTVTVTSRYNRYQLDSMVRLTDFEEMRGTQLNTVDGDRGPGFGLTINLDRLFKKKYRNKNEQERAFTQLEKDAYVDYRFSPQLVGLYTGLKGDKLNAFIRKNNPGYDWLRQHTTNEDILYYINEKLKASRR